MSRIGLLLLDAMSLERASMLIGGSCWQQTSELFD